MTGGSVEGLVNGGITRASNSRLIVDDLTDRAARFPRVNMLDAASQFCHIRWWLISSIAVVPSAVATDYNAFEVCVCHACAGRNDTILERAAGLPFCTYVPRLSSLALVAHHPAINWFQLFSVFPRQHNCGGGVGALIRRRCIVACEAWVASQQPPRDQWGHESNLRQVAPFFCRPRCASQCHIDRAGFCFFVVAHPTGQAAFKFKIQLEKFGQA